jgi:hypothetical protein
MPHATPRTHCTHLVIKPQQQALLAAVGSEVIALLLLLAMHVDGHHPRQRRSHFDVLFRE